MARVWVVPFSEFSKPRGWFVHLRLMDAEEEIARINAREAAIRLELETTIPSRRAKAEAELAEAQGFLKEYQICSRP